MRDFDRMWILLNLTEFIIGFYKAIEFNNDVGFCPKCKRNTGKIKINLLNTY